MFQGTIVDKEANTHVGRKWMQACKESSTNLSGMMLVVDWLVGSLVVSQVDRIHSVFFMKHQKLIDTHQLKHFNDRD